MKADRIVVDSNVLISALFSPGGAPRRQLEVLAVRNAVLLFSDATYVELITRLAKPKFDRYRTREQMEAFLDWLAELGEWVSPTLDVDASRDPDDDKFLALAIWGEVDCLITGDDDLLVLNPFEGVAILSPTDYLRLIGGR